jgi:hypothetical protein
MWARLGASAASNEAAPDRPSETHQALADPPASPPSRVYLVYKPAATISPLGSDPSLAVAWAGLDWPVLSYLPTYLPTYVSMYSSIILRNNP